MNKKYNKPSEKTKEQAQKIARGTQKPGQTKEQTKLIAQGIQKGIEQYKKQQKIKARELDKRLKQARNPSNQSQEELPDNQASVNSSELKNCKIPWILLALSWAFFLGAYFLI